MKSRATKKNNAETFCERVLEALNQAEAQGLQLKKTVMPPLNLYREACKRIEPMTKRVKEIAENTPMAKRFMGIPGVGPITALCFYAAIDHPERFKKSADVAAYFGFTPRQYQSGEVDYTGGISKRGDPATRRALVTAATVLLSHSNHWCSLKAWGVRLVKRIGFSKARIAVARKLAIIMHKMWLNNDRFRPKAIPLEHRKELYPFSRGANMAPA